MKQLKSGGLGARDSTRLSATAILMIEDAEGVRPSLRCVIFDLDSTIVDSDLDFAAIRVEIGTDGLILEEEKP